VSELTNLGQRDRKLVAVLIADVVGYARLCQHDDEGTHDRWDRHLSAARNLIAEYRGRIVKTTGDGFIAEFPSVVNAARAAETFLETIDKEEANADEASRIRLRMGLHFGDVIVGENGDIFGDGINIAARLEQKAAPGSILVVDSTLKLLKGKTRSTAEDLGEQRLKSFDQPFRLWQLRTSAIPAAKRRVWPRLPRAALGAFLALVIVAAFGLIWTEKSNLATLTEGRKQPPHRAKLSIVVLPFENTSSDPADGVYADAITDDLITDLSRITDAFVISSNTSFTLKGKTNDARQVAEQLAVNYALVGTVRRVAETLTVTASLIEAESGRVLWSQRFVRTREDMVSFQQDVTGQTARALNLELRQAESDKAARQGPKNLDAQDYALRAWAEIWNKPQSRATNELGMKLATQALAIEPNNSDALATLCYALIRAAQFGWSTLPADQLLDQAVAAGERAIELDARNADAFYVLAFALRVRGDIARAGSLLQTAVTLNPNHAPSHAALGLQQILNGDPNGAHSHVARALALSPLDPLRAIWFQQDGIAYLLAGDDVNGLAKMQEAIAANPVYPNPYLYSAAALVGLNRRAEAEVAFRRHEALRPGWTIERLKDAVSIQASPEFARLFERILDPLRSLGMAER
jgi:adenylate cyclase